MAGIFNIACSANGANTGKGKCLVKFTDIRHILIMKDNYELEVAQFTASSFATSLEAGIIAGNIFPITNVTFDAVADVGLQTQEIGGKLIPIQEGEMRATYKLVDTFGYLSNQLRKFNGGKWKIALIDGVGQVIAIASGTKLRGINANEVYFHTPTINVANGEMVMQMLSIHMWPAEVINDNMSIVQLGFPTLDIKGIVDVDVTVTAWSYGAGAGSITAVVTEKGNANSKVSGISKDVFKVLQNGSTISATSATESTEGTYTILATMDEDDFTLAVQPYTGYLFEGVSAEYTVLVGS